MIHPHSTIHMRIQSFISSRVLYISSTFYGSTPYWSCPPYVFKGHPALIDKADGRGVNNLTPGSELVGVKA